MKMNKKGFTLIELLIVVAIIAILAAIAIPQFAAYRIRGYNAAANSDIRNLKLAQESFKTDWQAYPSTAACGLFTPFAGCTGANGLGAMIHGPGNVVMNIAANGIYAAGTLPSAAAKHQFGLSNNVYAQVDTTANSAGNYVATLCHSQGDVWFGADSELTQIKMAGKLAITGAVTTLANKAAGAIPQAAPNVPSTLADTDLLAANWVSM